MRVVGRQGVDTRCDRGPDGRGQLPARDVVRHRRDQLFEEQRVALGDGDDALDRGRVGGGEERRHHGGRVPLRERLQRERRLTDAPATPRPRALEELRPGEGQHHDARIPDM